MKNKKLIFISSILSVSLLTACAPPADLMNKINFWSDKKSVDENIEEITDGLVDIVSPDQDGETNETDKIIDEDVDEKTAEEVIDEMKSDLFKVTNEKEEIEEELAYYKDYVQKVVLQLSEDKIQNLIDQEWKYTLTVNGVSFPSDGVLEMETRNAEIIFSEKRAEYSVLSEEQSNKGKLTGSFETSFSISDSSNLDKILDKSEDGNSTVIKYNLNDIEKNKEFVIKINEHLQKKLNLTKPELKLIIK